MGQVGSAAGAKGEGSNAGLIPAWTFDVAKLTSRQRVDAWRDVCSGFYEATANEAVADSLTAFSWHRLDDLMFSSGVSHPHVAKRMTAHVKRQRHYVRLLSTGRSTSRLVIDGQHATMGDGAIHLIDYSRPFVHVRNERIDLNGVYVPHDMIGYDPSRDPAYMRIDLGTPVGQILSGTFHAVMGQLPQITMTDAPMIAQGFTDLLRVLLLKDKRCERGLAVVRSARHQAMRRFIEKNLRDSSLGVESLRRSFGASRATIYRDFEADGGIARYIMNRRLDRALADLVGQPARRGLIGAVAEDWCFDGVSHFSHRFRQRFGCRPSEIATLAQPLAASGHGGPGSLSDRAQRFIEGDLSAWFLLD